MVKECLACVGAVPDGEVEAMRRLVAIRILEVEEHGKLQQHPRVVDDVPALPCLRCRLCRVQRMAVVVRADQQPRVVRVLHVLAEHPVLDRAAVPRASRAAHHGELDAGLNDRMPVHLLLPLADVDSPCLSHGQPPPSCCPYLQQKEPPCIARQLLISMPAGNHQVKA